VSAEELKAERFGIDQEGSTARTTDADTEPSDVGKSAEKSGGRPFQKGGDPRQGRGPRKGKGGRPTNEFRESVRALLDSPKVRAAIKKILADPDHRQFARLYQTLVSQAHGNPTQALTIVGEPSILTVVTKPSAD
jgi:hypothetical protein